MQTKTEQMIAWLFILSPVFYMFMVNAIQGSLCKIMWYCKLQWATGITMIFLGTLWLLWLKED